MTNVTAYINARILNPATSRDTMGGLIVEDGLITEVGANVTAAKAADVIDCGGNCLAPGLIDMRAFVGEPGFDHKESFASAGAAAAAGGITTLISQPQTNPIVDEPALAGFIARRARDTSAVNVKTMAAITKGLGGKEMTEMGLLAEAGAVAFTDGDRAVADARVMRRALAYAANWDFLIVQYPEDPSLAADGCMNEGELSSRLGLVGIPVAAEVEG